MTVLTRMMFGIRPTVRIGLEPLPKLLGLGDGATLRCPTMERCGF